MLLDVTIILICLCCFFTALAFILESVGCAFLAFVCWAIASLAIIRIDVVYTFWNTSSLRVVEYNFVYDQAWPLAWLFIGFAFAMFIYGVGMALEYFRRPPRP
jgi:hypothetical protein